MDVFGGGLLSGASKAVETVGGVFAPNSEAEAERRAEFKQAALAQFGAEFQHPRKGWFDRFMDGMNRLPRPLVTLGVFALFTSAMFWPIWFAERMQGLALVPEPLWWLAGTIVAFYFGGRFQVKSQEFHRAAAQSAAMVPQVMQRISALRELRSDGPGAADTGTDAALNDAAVTPDDNPAVLAWREENP
ncbi:MAG: carboxylesterase [Alphaproteobacteria bacterium]|nr:MAG: carboxylesterase [Alphaproteobacteria bacterium]